MEKATRVTIMHNPPPIRYQIRTPSQSEIGPATIKLRGIIAVAPAFIREKTRPRISGSIAVWKIAVNGPLANT